VDKKELGEERVNLGVGHVIWVIDFDDLSYDIGTLFAS